VKFPQQFIDEVKAAADIVTVISDYVSLRKAGARYKGLCPFHGEKTPSFSVDRDQGLFYCFGCGAGGDVVKFLELHEKIGFQDAVRQLAQRFGIPIPEIELDEAGRESAAEREALVRLHELAAAWFRQQLASPGAARVREYLTGPRGLTTATIDALQLGFAPPGRDALRQHLAQQGFAPAQILKSGLVSQRDDGSVVDRFRARLMVPIARDTGSIVGFGGRAMEADQQPKYLNSPETPIYTKSRTLYGLNLTKAEVRKANLAIIVEGYFDFAQVYQAGGFPVVATCGTALTPQQAQMLRRFATKAVLCYDPDAAGQAASERSSELLVGEGFDVNVALLPPGEDPDTFVQKRGRNAFLDQLRRSRRYLEFILDRAAAGQDLTRDDTRREFLQKMLGVAARIPDPAVRDQFADRLAHKARVTEDVVRAEIRKAAAARKTELPVERVPSRNGQIRPAERGLLWGLIHTPADVLPWLKRLEPADFEGLPTAHVLRTALDLDGSTDDISGALMERLDMADAQLLASAAAEAAPPVLSPAHAVASLKRLRLERDRADVQRDIDRLQAAGETGQELTARLERKLALQRELADLDRD
jgi:DNA primase